MNPKIQELAEKAGFYVTMFDDINLDNQKIENLVQLVIEECANIDFRHLLGISGKESYLVSNLIRENFKE